MHSVYSCHAMRQRPVHPHISFLRLLDGFSDFSYRASFIYITIRITNRCYFLYYVFISFFSSFPYKEIKTQYKKSHLLVILIVTYIGRIFVMLVYKFCTKCCLENLIWCFLSYLVRVRSQYFEFLSRVNLKKQVRVIQCRPTT